ncbi:MAG: alanyl-tRNA editing protein [Planctomycetota bacterium]
MSKPVCLDHPFQTTLETTIRSCEPDGERFRVTLDETLFYPEGGGQPSDRGTIGDALVVDVQKIEGVVVHWTDAPVLPDASVTLRLDWERRFDHMQQHTGQHLLTAVAADRFGWETTAFHLGSERCDIELTAAAITTDGLAALEAAVNAEIRAAHSVHIREVEPDELASLSVRSRGLPDDHVGSVRLIEIEGVDLNTCGGTHLATTAQLQSVALLGTEKIRGGTRLFFLCGERARSHYADLRSRESELGRGLSVGGIELVSAVDRLLETSKDERRTIKRLKSTLAAQIGRELAAPEAEVVRWQSDEPDLTLLSEIARVALGHSPGQKLLLMGGDEREGVFLIAGPEDWVKEQAPGLAAEIGGRGGGGRGRYQGRYAKDV